MLKYISIPATVIALVTMSSVAIAQETAQAGVMGPSGDAQYPLRVLGANKIVYHCKEETRTENGRVVRPCRRIGLAGSITAGEAAGAGASGGIAGAGAGGGLFGGGIGAAAALGAGVLGTIAIIAASDTN